MPRARLPSSPRPGGLSFVDEVVGPWQPAVIKGQ